VADRPTQVIRAERARRDDHVALFYADDAELTEAVCGRLAPALRRGAAAVVIATAAHRGQVLEGLSAHGVDVAAASDGERLVMRDAQDTLSRLLIDGAPDPAAFDAVVGSVVRDARQVADEVVAFGEMVRLLWDADEVVATLELERLWNVLRDQLGFALLCGYRREQSAATGGVDGFAEVCALHSEVLGAGPLLADADASRRFPYAVCTPAHARAYVADVLGEWGRAPLIDAAKLVVSELTTNAILHAGSAVSVSLERRGDTVRLAVGDASHAPPVRAGAGGDGGRGLPLIETLAGRWSHTALAGGKLVWVDLTPAGGSRSPAPRRSSAESAT
jgi:anti-sigma regulatory factor (Ser/Thr protein kinase)